ncbi:MAG TPA: MliC family protein [Allosphingosinicella sp.]|nr:MliC family protein [Allosphingosinicella sp.]
MRSAIILAGTALLAACGHHEEVAAGPGGLPYLCADGRAARIHYDGGDPNRMPARLSFDGHDYEMAPQPAMSGLRYRSEAGAASGRALVWAAEGEEAALIEAAEDGEREIVRCARVREGEAAPVAEAHGEDH